MPNVEKRKKIGRKKEEKRKNSRKKEEKRKNSRKRKNGTMVGESRAVNDLFRIPY